MRTRSEPPVPPDTADADLSRLSVFQGAALVLAVLMAFLPALWGGFIWDDDVYVTANPMLAAADGLKEIWFSAHTQSQYFPLTFTTLRLEHSMWGLNPVGYHAVNILLHAANAVLLWLLLRKMSVPAAWFGAALFALHPVQVETVAWVTELKNTQSTLFYLLALWAWIEFADRASPARLGCYALALVFGAMALFSKTTACTLPAAMLLALWLARRPIGWRRVVAATPFAVMGLAMGLVSVWWEGHLGNYVSESGVHLGLLDRLLIASRAIWFYLFKLAWPAHLTFSYPRWNIDPRDPIQYGWVLACVGVAAAGWIYRRKLGRGPIVAALFYAATLGPMLGFFPLYTFIYTFVADHYQYLACAGPLTAFAAALSLAARHRRVSIPVQTTLALALLGVLGGLTWHQCLAYRDRESLWRDTLRKNPDSWLARNNLGVALADLGRSVEAERNFMEVIQQTPEFSSSAHNGLGMLRANQGRIAEAETQFMEALRVQPNNPDVHYNLANLLARTGRINDAIPHYAQALKYKPADPDMHNNLAVALYTLGRPDLAIEHFSAALRVRPDSPELHCNLGNALLAARRVPEAEQEYRRALQLNPGFAQAAQRLKQLSPQNSNGPAPAAPAKSQP